ncbi:MAG: RNA 2'-phosphotransferase [Myxococcales bacterium]|nr:RNA 2'-phosphotransferase [Myxococcales bacterium]
MNDEELSKLLSFVLRHRPEHLGLSLDANGYVGVETLLSALSAQGHLVSLEQLRHVVATSDKQRFGFDAFGERIRARQGHSREVDLELVPVEPPTLLYHGTVERFLDAILSKGLLPRARQHVHLSADLATANNVGSRRGAPIILEVAAAAMFEAGHNFFLSENNVWLTAQVPPEFLKRATDGSAP